MNNLLKAPQAINILLWVTFYVLNSCSSRSNKGAICLLHTLGPFYSAQRGHCQTVFILSEDVLLFGSEGSRATARPLRSHSIHALPWQHLAPPSLNKHSMFDWAAAKRETELEENQQTEPGGVDVVLRWRNKKSMYEHMYVWTHHTLYIPASQSWFGQTGCIKCRKTSSQPTGRINSQFCTTPFELVVDNIHLYGANRLHSEVNLQNWIQLSISFLFPSDAQYTACQPRKE